MTPFTHLAKAVRLDGLVRVLDIGANPMDFSPPYKGLLAEGLAHVVGFEPQADALTRLNTEKSDAELYLPHAVGDGRAHQLNLYRGTGLVSLLTLRQKTLGYLRGLRRAARLVGSETIETKRLDDVHEVGRVDYFKIDIQGAEPMVFENASRALSEAAAVHTEVSFFPLYEDQRGFGEVDMMLREHGFLPHSFFNVVKRMVLSRRVNRTEGISPSQMLDGDVVYFRDLSNPDSLDDAMIARTAVIAEAIYGFTDLALRCTDILEDRGVLDIAEAEAFLAARSAA